MTKLLSLRGIKQPRYDCTDFLTPKTSSMKQLFVNPETLSDIDGARQTDQLPVDLQAKDVARVLFQQHVSTPRCELIFLQPRQASFDQLMTTFSEL